MAQLHVLTPKEINEFFQEEKTFFFFMKEKKRLQNQQYDAIGIYNEKLSLSFLKKYFQKNPKEATNYVAAPITLKNVQHLLTFCEKCNLNQICIADKGIFTIDNVKEAMQISDLLSQLEHKLDNENFYWIGFADGKMYTQQDSLCLYLNFYEAQEKANDLGGHLGTLNIVAPVFRECFKATTEYFINNMFIEGRVIKEACVQHFEKTSLSFELVKEYVDNKLRVYAGQNAWDEFEIFAHQGMSTFFSERADETLIHPLVQQSFPQDSEFYTVSKREALYEFATSRYIAIDCMYHCTQTTFNCAIMGRNDYREWNTSEMRNKTKELFETSYLYIILSREDYKERFHSSYPSIIRAERKKVWLFDDYGKALSFCQQKERFVSPGIPAIGLISSATQGWDLHSILSLLLMQGIEDAELNPLEDNRMLLSIKFMLRAQGLTPLKKEEIKRIQLDKSEDDEEEKPWTFNDIILA